MLSRNASGSASQVHDISAAHAAAEEGAAAGQPFDLTALPTDEAAAQKEHAGWSVRTQRMKEKLQESFESADTLSFKGLTAQQTRCALVRGACV